MDITVVALVVVTVWVVAVVRVVAEVVIEVVTEVVVEVVNEVVLTVVVLTSAAALSERPSATTTPALVEPIALIPATVKIFWSPLMSWPVVTDRKSVV